MTQEFRKSCVIGQPIAHSRSPLIHGYWLKRYAIAGSYTRIEVSPDDLQDFLKNLTRSGYAGCNITLPHKEASLKWLDDVSEGARRLGSINTVYVKDGKTYGMSTDGMGFLANLMNHHPHVRIAGSTVLILGAGGSSRAIIGELQVRGVASLFLANRTLARAEELQRKMGGNIVCLQESEIETVLSRVDFLINTTSQGMNGSNDVDLPLELLHKEAIVADIVYTPLKTALIAKAEARGLRTVPGLGMLLHQAVPGFERWFGVKPKVNQELYDLVAEDIIRASSP
jgi:shikimate dehydrogenase